MFHRVWSQSGQRSGRSLDPSPWTTEPGGSQSRHGLSPTTKINQSSLSEGDLRGGPESPTKPGLYWCQNETTSRALMLEVRVTHGELTVWWLNQDEPVANLKGRWRGPIPPSSGPGSHETLAQEFHWSELGREGLHWKYNQFLPAARVFRKQSFCTTPPCEAPMFGEPALVTDDTNETSLRHGS